MKTSSLDFDALRDEWPSFGFAAYAFSPGGPVTIEAIIQDETISASGTTLDEAAQRLAAILRPAEPELFDKPADLPEWVEPKAPDMPDIFG